MGTEIDTESVAVSGWGIDDRCWIAAAVALKRYKERQTQIRDEIDKNPKCWPLSDEEREALSKRLMQRLVERS